MTGLKSICLTLCYTCVAVCIVTMMIPQKRTRRIMSFVVGLFFISTLVTSICAQTLNMDLTAPKIEEIPIPTYSDQDYQNIVAQQTADNLTSALNEILANEGICVQDIRLTLKISDEGRISVVRAVIYISDEYRDQTARIKSIIYRNVSKEPEIYVTGEEAQRTDE